MKNFSIIFFIHIVLAGNISAQWNPIGGLNGFASNSPGSASNVPIDINSDGTVRAYSDYANDIVRVSILKNGQWLPMGDDITDIANKESFGRSISLNASGTTIAISSYGEFLWTVNQNVSKVYILDFINEEWQLRGSPIFSDQLYGSYSGSETTISADGNKVLIAEKFHDNGIDNGNITGPNFGKVSTYEWSDNNWIQLGNEIYGSVEQSRIGEQFAFSADGLSFAVSENGNDTEVVKVFRWNGNTWNQLGAPIENNDYYHFFSWELGNISLNGNGEILIIGSPNQYDEENESGGKVRVYEWNGFEWDQRGQSILDQNNKSALGNDVDISYDGNIICIGSPFSEHLIDENLEFKGFTQVFEWDGSNYQLLGNSIQSEFPQDRFGHSVAISGDGKTMLASTDYDEFNYSRVYQYNDMTSDKLWNSNYNLILYPNPTNNVININIPHKDIIEYQIFNSNGVEIINKPNSSSVVSTDFNLNLSELATGYFIIRVKTNRNTKSFKFIKT